MLASNLHSAGSPYHCGRKLKMFPFILGWLNSLRRTYRNTHDNVKNDCEPCHLGRVQSFLEVEASLHLLSFFLLIL